MANHEDVSHQFIEGISNDALLAAGVALATLILTIAWYSTQLTSGQRNLPDNRTIRRGLNIRRIPGSSSREYAQRNQSLPPQSPPNETESPSGMTQVPTQEGDQPAPSHAEPTSVDSTDDGDTTATLPSTSSNDPSAQDPAVASSGLTNSEAQNSTQSSPPLAPEMISVKLMSLDGQERIVSESYDTTIDQLRQKHYQPEIEAGKLVRFIHSGRSLLDDDRLDRLPRTGSQLVLHISIAERRPQTDTDAVLEVATFNAGVFMVPMFAVVLSLLWILRFQYGHLFNVTSTVSLGGITAVFLYSLHAVSRGNFNRPNNIPRRNTYTIRLTGNGNRGMYQT